MASPIGDEPPARKRLATAAMTIAVEADVLALLVSIDSKLALLLANTAHAQLLPPPHLTREDRTRLATMLPAIAGVYGSETFTSRDLAEDTSPAVRLVVRGLSVKRISKLFSRAAGVPIDGLMVRNHGKEFQVSQWEIVAC